MHFVLKDQSSMVSDMISGSIGGREDGGFGSEDSTLPCQTFGAPRRRVMDLDVAWFQVSGLVLEP